MAHGLNSVLKRGPNGPVGCNKAEGKGIGSRRIFAPHFKLQVLDSYRNDADCKGNQRATARKYGIHRRQIQKWLQVENALRSSVSAKEKSEVRKCEADALTLNGNRQLDGALVPAPTRSSPCPWPADRPLLPLDFTTHGRGGRASPPVASSSPPPSDHPAAAPIDLSLKRPTSMASGAPVSCYAPLSPLRLASPGLAKPDPDVWDLSTKGLKRKLSPARTSPKPVKLFKPYLDDVREETPPPPPSIVKLEALAPCCSALGGCDTFYYNNNNVCDIKSEYSGYTLHELQPKSTVNYYYYPAGPYPEYEAAGGYVYEDISYGQGLAPLKQRQSYSLDFKLSAIDCYYQDSVCKGNQRAVATKYNIHRRQIQKWLKQAEELRLRNESANKTHAVR